MKIILKKEVTNLGEAGDVVEVKTGYALNYLVPQGFATIGTPSALKQHEETLRQRAHKEAKLVADAEALAAKISAVEVPVTVKVNQDGKIFTRIQSHAFRNYFGYNRYQACFCQTRFTCDCDYRFSF